MKKVTITYSSEIQKLIVEGKVNPHLRWCDLPLMLHIYALITHVHQVGLTGRLSEPLIPISTSEDVPIDHMPSASTLCNTYRRSHRMEVQVFTNMITTCLGVNFLFYKSGKGNVPILILEGSVDFNGIQYLRVK